MKTLLIATSILFTLFSPLHALTMWRFEWQDASPNPFHAQIYLPTETAAIGSGSIGSTLGEFGRPIPGFPFEARDNGFDGFAPRTFTLDPDAMWGIFSGIVGWDNLTIYGDWFILFGLDRNNYDMLVTGDYIEARWDNVVSERHDGSWVAKGPFSVPDSGSTLLLLGMGTGLLVIGRYKKALA
jgi:hypothetical protein